MRTARCLRRSVANPGGNHDGQPKEGRTVRGGSDEYAEGAGTKRFLDFLLDLLRRCGGRAAFKPFVFHDFSGAFCAVDSCKEGKFGA